MRRLLVSIATAMLAAGGFPGAASAAGFYDPPNPLPRETPGTLIRAERMVFRGLGRPDAGTVGWRILYVSRTALGEPVAVSGSVLLPSAEQRPRPLVAFAPGSHGLGDQCAASRQLASGADADLDQMKRLLASGSAVVVTDYQGLGTPGGHPFGVNVAAGRNVLDSLRAARQLEGTGLEPDGKLGIYGYSQGGGAAGSAAEQQPSYAPELRISGAVVGGVLGEPARLPNYLFGNFWAGVAMFAVDGYDAAYPELGLRRWLNPLGRSVFRWAEGTCMESGFPLQFSQMSWYTVRGNPVKTASWQARLKENTLGYETPEIPIYQFHGEWDQVLSYGSAKRVRARWCARGADVRFVTIKYSEHFMAGGLALDHAARWLQGRFDGATYPGNCDR